jgi:hypothetical protein
MDQVYMHLTNYSLNKFSKGFVKNEDDNEDVASKRSVERVCVAAVAAVKTMLHLLRLSLRPHTLVA